MLKEELKRRQDWIRRLEPVNLPGLAQMLIDRGVLDEEVELAAYGRAKEAWEQARFGNGLLVVAGNADGQDSLAAAREALLDGLPATRLADVSAADLVRALTGE